MDCVVRFSNFWRPTLKGRNLHILLNVNHHGKKFVWSAADTAILNLALIDSLAKELQTALNKTGQQKTFSPSKSIKQNSPISKKPKQKKSVSF